jgi:hypothetical protein
MKTETRVAEKLFDGGEVWWNVRDECGIIFGVVATLEEAKEFGISAGHVVACNVIETDEPLFLVRDDSGRGIAEPVSYLQFDSADREYFNRENDDTTDEFTFGEWLDSSSIGDEYRNDDQNFTVIRTR